jgi:hypothetical protein
MPLSESQALCLHKPKAVENQERETLDPYRRCPGGQNWIAALLPGAGAFSIRPFQVSRWRLRRTRQLWVFNCNRLEQKDLFGTAGQLLRANWAAEHHAYRRRSAVTNQPLALASEWNDGDLHRTRSVRRASGLLETAKGLLIAVAPR